MSGPVQGDTAARAFRFGLGPAGLGGGRNAPQWRDYFRHVEDLGYHAVAFGDHIDGRPAPGHAALSAALWTDRLRGAVHVHANDFRHPALLARELSTISMLTGGRFDAGLGAGWMAADYNRLGVPFDSPGARIDRLREAVRLLKLMWNQETVELHGEHYDVQDLVGSPLLEGSPAPRLIMGGGGPKMLTLAAQEADIVSVNVRLDSGKLGPERGRSATIAAVEEKFEIVRAAAGPRFDDLVLQVELHCVEVTTDRQQALDRAADTLALSVDEVTVSPHVLVGSVDEICDLLVQRREQFGISYVCMTAAATDNFAPVVARLAGT